MYDLVTKLKKIGDWDIVKNNLYAIQDNQVKKFNLKGEFINNIYTLKKYWGVNFYDDFFHIYTMYSENTFVDYNKKVLLEKDNFNFYHIFTPNRYIGFDRTIKKVVNQDKVILFNERINLRSVISNYFIFTNKHKNIIFTIDLDHPEKPLWQFDLSQLGTFQDYHNEQQSYKVEKILGIHNEHLYVALNGSLLLELDIATGKITHKWHHLPEKYKEYPDDDFSARLFDLDKANNALVCLSGRRYDSIDLQTKEYNSVYIGEELKKYDIVSIRHQGDFTNEHISAVAHLKNDTWFQDGIVMFNRKTNKIDFFYKDETFTTGTATPKLADNKLYQLDLDGNLYIFEKGENNIQT